MDTTTRNAHRSASSELLPPDTYALRVLWPKIDERAHQAHVARVKASRAELFEIAREVFADAVRVSLDGPALVMPLVVNVSIEMPPTHRDFEVAVQLADVKRAARDVTAKIRALGFDAACVTNNVESFANDGGHAPRTWQDIVDSGRAGEFLEPAAFSTGARNRIYPTSYLSGPRVCWQFLISVAEGASRK